MLQTYFVGMIMGIADLVPGVSGGTIAFIMGIYERLINAIKGVGTKHWDPKFLLPLLSGIAVSILTLAHLLEVLLNNPEWRSYLYATFLGMILGSTVFCSKQVKQWSNSRIIALIVGITAAFLLTGHVHLSATPPMNETVWIAFCGAIAVSAMLLPGISGSYLLTILGVYPTVIQNLNAFTRGLVSGVFETQPFLFILTLLAGIICGAIVFSRVVSWALKHYHDISIATLTGFMLGGLPAVWPFWIYDSIPHLVKPEKGLVLVPRQMILPDLSSQLFMFAVLCMAMGFMWVMWAEWVVSRRKA